MLMFVGGSWGWLSTELLSVFIMTVWGFLSVWLMGVFFLFSVFSLSYSCYVVLFKPGAKVWLCRQTVSLLSLHIFGHDIIWIRTSLYLSYSVTIRVSLPRTRVFSGFYLLFYPFRLSPSVCPSLFVCIMLFSGHVSHPQRFEGFRNDKTMPPSLEPSSSGATEDGAVTTNHLRLVPDAHSDIFPGCYSDIFEANHSGSDQSASSQGQLEVVGIV